VNEAEPFFKVDEAVTGTGLIVGAHGGLAHVLGTVTVQDV
jgi:hypothetical protein